jgi:hypothetical protein
VTDSLRRAAGPLLVVALTVVLTGCGGGFSANPAPPPDQTIHSYVALGDGFAAAPYTGQTADDDGCLRSKENYPALVAEELDVEDFRDVSCTGATTDALTKKTKPAKGKDSVAPQLDAVTEDTDLVTIGMGIEDGDLLHSIFNICAAQPCAPGSVIYTAVLEDLDRATEAMTTALRDIQAKAPGAYIVVVGYPMLTAPPGSACNAFPTQPALPDGTDPVSYVLDKMNTQMRLAARQVGGGYVDVADLSADHVLCSDKPWVSDMKTKPGKEVAYHPLAAEQRAVAEQVATQVKER